MTLLEIVYIGIDPSINSTGVSIYFGGKYCFYIITGSLTKKECALGKIRGKNYSFEYVLYNKQHIEGDYHEKEVNKTKNMLGIVECLLKIIKRYKKYNIVIGIEGISYGSVSRTSAIYDLAGLNYLIRSIFIADNLYVISPSDNKKFATGKGNANKETMQVGFAALFPKLTVLKKYDDLADAYWLCTYVQNLVQS